MPVEVEIEPKVEDVSTASNQPGKLTLQTKEAVHLADPNSIPSTGSEVMDGILLHSQQRMLEAIGALGVKLDGLHGESDLKRGFDE